MLPLCILNCLLQKFTGPNIEYIDTFASFSVQTQPSVTVECLVTLDSLASSSTPFSLLSMFWAGFEVLEDSCFSLSFDHIIIRVLNQNFVFFVIVVFVAFDLNGAVISM